MLQMMMCAFILELPIVEANGFPDESRDTGPFDLASTDGTISHRHHCGDSHLLSQWVALTDNVYNQPI